MRSDDFLIYEQNEFSQNGEDGIIEALFSRIGVSSKTCCEFGAWDGIHFSNCRKLILQDWQAVLIEGNPHRFDRLRSVYQDNPKVICLRSFVDAHSNRLDTLLDQCNIRALDFLSIDIDGLDYDIYESLSIRPKVVCIEVNAGHSPTSDTMLPRDIAQNNVGQPLSLFAKLAAQNGYGLVCYTGNAFFVQRDIIKEFSLPSLSNQLAYEFFLRHLTTTEREWLYLVNLGIVPPYHQFNNPYLTRSALGITLGKSIAIQSAHRSIERFRRIAHLIKQKLT